jgi:hypothetical protein
MFLEPLIIFLSNFDELVKSRKTPFFVIPAKAGIQFFQLVTEFLDSGFHRSDDFLRNHQFSSVHNLSITGRTLWITRREKCQFFPVRVHPFVMP